jgi:hypothetical protein
VELPDIQAVELTHKDIETTALATIQVAYEWDAGWFLGRRIL